MKAEVSTSTSGLATTDDLIDVLSRSRVTRLHQALVSHPGAGVVGRDHRSQGAPQQLCQRDPESLCFSLRGGVLFLARTDLRTDHDDVTPRSVIALARSGPNERPAGRPARVTPCALALLVEQPRCPTQGSQSSDAHARALTQHQALPGTLRFCCFILSMDLLDIVRRNSGPYDPRREMSPWIVRTGVGCLASSGLDSSRTSGEAWLVSSLVRFIWTKRFLLQ